MDPRLPTTDARRLGFVECAVRLHPNDFSQISEREAHAVNHHTVATEVETVRARKRALAYATHSRPMIRGIDGVGITSACRTDEASEAAGFCDALAGRYRSSDAMKLLQSTHIHAQQTPDGGVSLPHPWRCTFPNYHGTLPREDSVRAPRGSGSGHETPSGHRWITVARASDQRGP